jgi:hypothetical protein
VIAERCPDSDVRPCDGPYLWPLEEHLRGRRPVSILGFAWMARVVGGTAGRDLADVAGMRTKPAAFGQWPVTRPPRARRCSGGAGPSVRRQPRKYLSVERLQLSVKGYLAGRFTCHFR